MLGDWRRGLEDTCHQETAVGAGPSRGKQGHAESGDALGVSTRVRVGVGWVRVGSGSRSGARDGAVHSSHTLLGSIKAPALTIQLLFLPPPSFSNRLLHSNLKIFLKKIIENVKLYALLTAVFICSPSL